MRNQIRLVSSMLYFVLVALFGLMTNAATNRQIARRQTTSRPQVIVLENGATTFVSSLDEHLITQTEETPRASPELLSDHVLDTTSSELPNGTNNKSGAVIFKMSDVPSQDSNETSASVTSWPTTQTEAAQQQQQHQTHNEHQVKHTTTTTTTSTNQTQKPIPQHWQVKSLLNVTHDYPLAYSQIICGYVWPLMAALTLFTNLMIVFVLTQRDMRTPTNVVLTAIAIADIIPIVVPVPWFVYLFAMGNEKQVLFPPIACYFYQHSTRSVSEIFYFVSTWLNVLLAVQDYLVACRPKLAQKYCRIRVVIVEIVLLTLLAFLLNLPQALKLVFKPVKFYYNGQITWGCKAMQARWFKDFVGEHVALYDDIFTAIIVLLVDGGPALVLITLTALLIRQLQRQRIQGHLLMEQARTASKRRRERHRQQESEASARVMIFVLLAFLAVKIPFATTYTLMIIQSRFEIHFVENLVDFQKAITLTDLIFVLSYPINFTIFCCCSKKFRHKCAQLLGECNHSTKTTRDRFMSSFNSDSFIGRRLSSLSSSGGSGSRGRNSFSYGTALDRTKARNSTASFATGTHQDEMQRQGTKKPPKPNETFSLPPPPLPPPNWLPPIGATDIHCNNDKHNASQPRDSLSEPNLYSIPGSPQLKTLLESGGLCLECVMYYERLKSVCSVSDVASLTASSTAQPPQVAPAASLEPEPEAKPFVLMPVPTPPQPPRSLASLLQEQQRMRQDVPKIITTTCESLSEHQSDSSTDKLQDDEQETRMRSSKQFNSGQVDGRQDASADGAPASHETREATEVEDQGPNLSFDAVEHLAWRTGTEPGDFKMVSSSGERWPSPKDVRRSSSRGSDERETPLSRRHEFVRASVNDLGPSLPVVVTPSAVELDAAVSCHQDASRETKQPQARAQRVTNRLVESGESSSSSELSDLSPSRDGESTPRSRGQQCFGERATASERMFRKGRKSGGGRLDGGHLSLTPRDDRKRSLSLSNSNLAILPNATGILADALVSVLFGAGASGNAAGKGKTESARASRSRRKPSKANNKMGGKQSEF